MAICERDQLVNTTLSQVVTEFVRLKPVNHAEAPDLFKPDGELDVWVSEASTIGAINSQTSHRLAPVLSWGRL
jgi:hypothetical protein